MKVLFNNIIQIESSKYLQAGEYERNDDRERQTNGYKPKTVKVWLGGITFALTQLREGIFYPSELENRVRN